MKNSLHVDSINRKIFIYNKGLYLEVLFDDDCFDFLSTTIWTYRCGYASRPRKSSDMKGNSWVHFHREIFRIKGIIIPEKMDIDHINRNKLDNRFCNLRISTRSANIRNMSESSLQKRRNAVAKATIFAAKKERTRIQLEASKNSANKMNNTGSNRHIGIDNYASKRVINSLTGDSFNSIKDAAIFYGLVYSTLKSRLNGSLKNNTNLRSMNV